MKYPAPMHETARRIVCAAMRMAVLRGNLSFQSQRSVCNNQDQYRSGKTKGIRVTTRINPSPSVARSSMFAAILVTFGCTSLGFGIRERAEAAFRLQNQLSSEFMLAALEIERKVPTMHESLLITSGAGRSALY